MTRNRTTIEFWDDGDSWKATEPRSDADLIGRGTTPTEATKHYVELVEDSAPDREGSVDD
jgi:hypothetical protein